MNKTEIGTLIQQRRDQLRINQQDLAEMTGLTPKTIYFVETGKGNPSVETVLKILEVLGLEININIKKLAE